MIQYPSVAEGYASWAPRSGAIHSFMLKHLSLLARKRFTSSRAEPSITTNSSTVRSSAMVAFRLASSHEKCRFRGRGQAKLLITGKKMYLPAGTSHALCFLEESYPPARNQIGPRCPTAQWRPVSSLTGSWSSGTDCDHFHHSAANSAIVLPSIVFPGGTILYASAMEIGGVAPGGGEAARSCRGTNLLASSLALAI